MRIAIITIALISMSAAVFAQNDSKKPEDQIRKYWFVLLKSGTNTSQDSLTAAKIQKGHLNNITKLYNDGKLKVAGPFGEKGDWKGIFVLDCETKEDAEKLLQSDPTISAGRLSYELKPWYTAPIGSFTPGKPAKPYPVEE